MKKIFIITLTSISMHSFAYFNYSNFQHFDNQIGFGMSAQQGNFNTRDAANHPNVYDMVALNLEVEKLFDVGLWLDVNVSNLQTYTQTTAVNPLGAYPFIATFNAKVGYNIAFTNFFSMTPYINFGKNANLTAFTGTTGGATINQGVSKDFFYTPGIGLRFEFPINKYVEVFFDQMYAYNYDQSNIPLPDTKTIIIASNSQWTSILGVKVDLWENLQLAANVFYTNYNDYNQASLAYLSSTPADGLLGLPTTATGIQGSVGFTF